jgi:hypothetical protein
MGRPVSPKALNLFPEGTDERNSIGIVFRSFLFPVDTEDHFPLGEPIPLRVPAGMDLRKLTETVFTERVNQIGMVAVNGEKAEGNRVLKDGDRVDVYEMLGGG